MGIKQETFPIISEIIDKQLLLSASINRDEIAQQLLKHPKVRKLAEEKLKNRKTNNIFDVVGNMVDWFSADISRKTNLALPYINRYFRKKVKIKTRKIWEYRLCEEKDAFEVANELPEQLFEGSVKQITVNAYERNSKAKIECKNIYGVTCVCCGFNFHKKYGDIGQGFIHIHHLKQISEIKENYKIDPKTDLRPVCPNCHAMIHQKKPPFSIEEIKEFIKMN